MYLEKNSHAHIAILRDCYMLYCYMNLMHLNRCSD